mmetsp:Transcript_56549/g.143321  ORF Transcript_56549/g.143321 Transcript_56549/m.143321 type:complete len:209 (-) Transcript_56549:176-802(-)
MVSSVCQQIVSRLDFRRFGIRVLDGHIWSVCHSIWWDALRQVGAYSHICHWLGFDIARNLWHHSSFAARMAFPESGSLRGWLVLLLGRAGILDSVHGHRNGHTRSLPGQERQCIHGPCCSGLWPVCGAHVLHREQFPAQYHRSLLVFGRRVDTILLDEGVSAWGLHSLWLAASGRKRGHLSQRRSSHCTFPAAYHLLFGMLGAVHSVA